MKSLSPSEHAQLFNENTSQFWNHVKPILLIGFCIHFAFILIFMLYEPLLSAFNIFSVFIYLICLRAVRTSHYKLIGILMSLEIILHAAFATWAMGWGSNFYFYLYCLIPIIAFSFQNSPLLRLLLYFAILTVSIVGFGLHTPLVINTGIAPKWLKIISVFNMLAALCTLLHCTNLAVRFTRSVQAELFKTAIRDSLTNLYTRRRIMNEIKQLADYAPSTIILIDIDHFKKINDLYGHERGDLILQRVAEVLSSRVRATDLASRWGGEEFLVLMPYTPAHMAKDVADRILLQIREWVGEFSDSPLTVTATLAVSEFHYKEDFENALIRADKALYQGKNQGRNQVIFAS
ncbi:GGDEF domain-containing protein [Enterobacter mori]